MAWAALLFFVVAACGAPPTLTRATQEAQTSAGVVNPPEAASPSRTSRVLSSVQPSAAGTDPAQSFAAPLVGNTDSPSPTKTPPLLRDFPMVFLGSEPDTANGQPAIGYHFALGVQSSEFVPHTKVRLHSPSCRGGECGWRGPIRDRPAVIVLLLPPSSDVGPHRFGVTLLDGRRAEAEFTAGVQPLRAPPPELFAPFTSPLADRTAPPIGAGATVGPTSPTPSAEPSVSLAPTPAPTDAPSATIGPAVINTPVPTPQGSLDPVATSSPDPTPSAVCTAVTLSAPSGVLRRGMDVVLLASASCTPGADIRYSFGYVMSGQLVPIADVVNGPNFGWETSPLTYGAYQWHVAVSPFQNPSSSAFATVDFTLACGLSFGNTGRQTFTTSGGTELTPRSGAIDPYEACQGETQAVEFTFESTDAIVSVTIHQVVDGVSSVPVALTLASGSATSGTWAGTWSIPFDYPGHYQLVVSVLAASGSSGGLTLSQR